MSRFNQKIILPVFAAALSSFVVSCGGGSSDGSSSNIIIAGDKPIAYVERNANATGNPTDAATCSAGGRLLIRKLSSASSTAQDVTTQITNGNGDVSDLEASYDGTKILFSMKPNCGSGTWDIYEYDTSKPASSTNPRRVIASDAEANKGDDIDPAYVPRDSGDLIVFSSNRQVRMKEIMTINKIEPYSYRDEYERERVSALHTMTAGGENIRQISFNQSHDRNPTVLSTGEIMYSRWDHVGGRNQFSVFTTNPDGTNMFIFYGAHSGITSLLHPREMPDKKTIISSAMSLSGTKEGGAILLINSNDCSENSDCDGNITGQAQATAQQMNTGRGISQFGRATDPYPLYDGTNRVLVSWAASCAAIDIEKCPKELNLANNLEEPSEGPAQYGIYMLNLDTKDLDIIDRGTAGKILRSPIALIARAKPNGIADKSLDTTLAAKNSGAGVGIFNVKSVYDTDSIGRMGNGTLISGVEPSIPQTTAPDGRTVADIAAMKDPDNTASGSANYKTRPARFVRITKAVPTPAGMGQNDMGETDFEMQQIVGYSEVEPDGSFKVEVPADTPLAISILDAEGRAFQHHTNWIQARPGETRTCNGCHSPRRGSAINASPIAGSHSNGNDLVGKAGETMAETRFNKYPNSYPILKDDIKHPSDVWATAAQTAATPSKNTSAINIDYSGTPVAPINGVVNYPEHVQAIWDKDRTWSGADFNVDGVNLTSGDTYQCTSCHNENTQDDETNPVFQRTAGLDLTGGIGGAGYLTSYSELMVGDPLLDASGLPTVTIAADGQVRIQRERSYVSVASARNSILVAVLYNEQLKSGNRQITKGGVLTDESIANISLDHSFMTNASERRVINEWIDLGGQYYNTAFKADANSNGIQDQEELRSPARGLSASVFSSTVHPILMRACAGCHQAFNDGDSTTGTANQAFTGRNRFVLTGNLEGDLNITTTMVTDTSTAANNKLLSKPTSTDGGVHPQVGGAAVMATGSADYNAIASWITP